MATRDEFSDTERAPSATVNHKKDVGEVYEMNVSTVADEFAGNGWVQRTRPLGSKGNPLKTAGTAGACDDSQVDSYEPGGGESNPV